MTVRPPASDVASRVVFAIGTGRCGTEFFQRLFALAPEVASWHERHPLADAFHRYCQWNGLPVDHEGFLATKEAAIRQDLSHHVLSFESSAYLSLSVPQLFERFSARFLLLVRRPDRVVSSFLAKGWYSQSLARADPTRALGYQPDPQRPHHPFARLAPIGDEATGWADYTRVGKLAWFWRALNERTLSLVERLPPTHWRLFRLEDFDFEAYSGLSDQLGIPTALTRKGFEALTASRPNTLKPTMTVADWGEKAAQEFEREVAPVAERLGYTWRVQDLRAEVAQDSPPTGPEARGGAPLRQPWGSLLARLQRGRGK